MASARLVTLGLIAVAFAANVSAQETTVWRHGTVAPKGDAGFVYMAADKGFDKKNGIRIEITALKGDALLTKALLAGELDSYEGNPGGPMIAANKGADIRVLGCNWPGLPYSLYTRNDVKSLADLKGKAIAVSDPGALPDLFARAALQSGGLDPNKDVTYVRAGSDSDRVKALAAGVVAAAPSSNEFEPKAKELGLKLLVRAKDVTPNYVRSCIITTAKVLSTKRRAAVGFIAAEMEGHRYALDHESENIALAQKITNAKPGDPNAKQIVDEVKAEKLVDPELNLDPKKFTYLRDLLADGGLIPKTFDPSVMLDPSVRIEAAKIAAQAK